MSTLELIKDISKEFSDKGIDSSNVEAEAIVQDVLGCNRIALYLEDITLSDNQSLSIENMVERRLSGEPLQHVIGKVVFYGNEICVKKGVFIPRPETEILVEKAIGYVLRLDKEGLNILDLCTGSGCIACSMSLLYRNADIMGSDISEKTLEVAQKNAENLNLANNIEFVKSNLFAKIKGKFDQKYSLLSLYISQERH